MLGVLVGATLAVAAGTASAHALWQVREPVAVTTAATGGLGLTARWLTPVSVPALYPGAHGDTSVLRVSGTGTGTTLRWNLSVRVQVAAGVAAYVRPQVWRGACGTGTLLGATTQGQLTTAAYSPAGGLAPTDSVDLCVRVPLAADAPADLVDTALAPSIALTALQRGSG